MCKVNIWAFSSCEGKYLYKGTCFENSLLQELEYFKNEFKDKFDFKLLFNEIKETQGHPQDILDSIFRENVTIDFEFARQIKLYDILGAGCFYSENDIGKEMIELIDLSDIRFILVMRNWETTNEITLDFEVAHSDYDMEVHAILTKNELE